MFIFRVSGVLSPLGEFAEREGHPMPRPPPEELPAFLVIGVWCLVFDVWCLVSGVWCLVFGVWCLVLGVWCCPLQSEDSTTLKVVGL